MTKSIPESANLAFREKRLIPIVGAGVSMSLKHIDGNRLFPSWRELLTRCSSKLGEEDKPELAALVEANLGAEMFKEAATAARKGLVGRLWGRFFREIFAIDKDEIDAESLQLPAAIWKISSRIVTLNYDKVLRMAAPEPDSIMELDNNTRSELIDFARDTLDKPAIWHLHGKIDNVANIVFTTDSYDKLYLTTDDSYAAALEAFRTLIRNTSFIFVGCSLDDADLLRQLAQEQNLFEGNSGPHYALVHSRDQQMVKQKLKDLPIELIIFSDFGKPLLDKIDEIVDTRTSSTTPSTKFTTSNLTEVPRHIKIAVLSANPITKGYDYSPELREIKKLKSEVYYGYLTLKNLQDLDDFDYLIILTQTIKTKFVVEDDAAGYLLVSLKDIQDNIGCDLKGMFVFSNHEDENLPELCEISAATPTIVFPKLTKNQLESLFFKLFKKKNLHSVETAVTIAPASFVLLDLLEEYCDYRPRTPLPETIDVKTTINYVGRKTDLENIARKVIELRERNEILTIKGSGGIGKTMTIKKIVVEMAWRNHFRAGIDFIDCEPIADLKNLEYNIARSFNLEKASDIRTQIRENFEKQDALLVLDNLESLLHLEDRAQILDFLTFICDYTSVLVTSRETMNIECEQVYELRPFTTDEAFDLFRNEYRSQPIPPTDLRIIREDILEGLLDNNPLAIKLITRNIPPGTNFRQLRAELQNDIFRQVTDAELSAFDDIDDMNIERKKSVYASINFSYQYLNDKEKKAFELLSLFPDGINIENFKRISEQQSGKKNHPNEKKLLETRADSIITDKIIKSLEDKSMIQINNSMIKLQSIIGKFAEHKLSSRSPEEIKRYQTNAFEYNYSFANTLVSIINNEATFVAKIFNSHQANFLKSISYVTNVAAQSFESLNYVNRLSLLFVSISAGYSFLEALKRHGPFDFDDVKMQTCYLTNVYWCRYYNGEFATAFKEVKQLISLEELQELNDTDPVERLLLLVASDIYCMEGDALLIAQVEAANKDILNSYSHSLFHIGELYPKLAQHCVIDFFTLEARYALGILSQKTLDEYLSEIHVKSHLERIQTTYIKAKAFTVSRQAIKKLVAVNPYTAGLKSMMFAFIESDHQKAMGLYEAALAELLHIKYYYVECLYFYAKYLKSIGQSERFDSVYSEGNNLARQHYYRWLIYEFEALLTPKNSPYCPVDYPLPVGVDFQQYIKLLLSKT